MPLPISQSKSSFLRFVQEHIGLVVSSKLQLPVDYETVCIHQTEFLSCNYISKYSQLSISQTLISQCIHLYQRIQFRHISDFYFHFNSCLSKTTGISKKNSGARKFTLRYQYFGMNFDLEISRVSCSLPYHVLEVSFMCVWCG